MEITEILCTKYIVLKQYWNHNDVMWARKEILCKYQGFEQHDIYDSRPFCMNVLNNWLYKAAHITCKIIKHFQGYIISTQRNK